ncbi:MAG: RNA-binding protein [Pseudomonadota bacterium]
MVTLSIRGLSPCTTEESLSKLFSEFGVVHSVSVVRDLFTGKCRGFATIKMEGHEARLALSEMNNREVSGSTIRVYLEKAKLKTVKRRR